MIPDIIKNTARDLRKNMTEAEKILYNYIKEKKLGVKFHRQKPLYVYTENNGFKRYIIPDFYCIEKQLIVEIDGNIHDEKEIYKLDKEKEKLIKQRGLNIIRIKNSEIYNDLDNTIRYIQNNL